VCHFKGSLQLLRTRKYQISDRADAQSGNLAQAKVRRDLAHTEQALDHLREKSLPRKLNVKTFLVHG
jgi:hypothetical protein